MTTTLQRNICWLLASVLCLLIDASLADAALHISSPLRTTTASLRRNLQPSDVSAGKAMSPDAASTSALFQSDSTVDPLLRGGSAGAAGTLESSSSPSTRFLIPEQILQSRTAIYQFCTSTAKSSWNVLKRCWWALPMSLAIVPVYSALVCKVWPTMPYWWPLTRMDQLFTSPSWGLIVTVFLSSNLFYFASGAYLLGRFSWNNNRNDDTRNLKGFPMLGTFIIAAGTVSTIFHYFQALGSFRIAEALCYLDHAVAISAISYFWHRCGRPGLAASLMATAGLATLAITKPIVIYPYLHSAWHGLSAGAAVFWAHDGMRRRVSMMVMEEEEDVVGGNGVIAPSVAVL